MEAEKQQQALLEQQANAMAGMQDPMAAPGQPMPAQPGALPAGGQPYVVN